MSEAKINSLTLDDLMIGEPISEHHGIKCCPAIHEATEERYIVKFISIPASQVQLDALLLTGAYPTPAQAMEYFRDRAEEVLQEVKTLDRLHSMEGFLPFTHGEIRKKENGVGYEVCLISPYKRSLSRQMQLQPLTHLGAVNLGLDLCAALAICRRAGFLYVDLKPSNVYITPNQGYRISDLGFIALNSMKYASYPEQYRSPYTAPEIADALSALNTRIDIYALGLILYQVYNNSELPAEIGGELPPPAYADYEMAEIILKACHPDPKQRWSDPLLMGQAIVSYMQRNSVNDTPIVPPPVEVPPEPVVEEVAQPELAEEPDMNDDPIAMLDSILNTPVDIKQEVVAVDVSQELPAPEAEPVSEEADAADKAEISEKSTEDPDAPTIELNETPETNVEEDLSLNLSFIVDLSEDETAPTEESAAEIQIDLVSDEVQDMLARADELISHELPEPAVAPEPIEVPFPAPIVLLDEEEEEDEADDTSVEIPVVSIGDLTDADDQESPIEDEDVVEEDEPETDEEDVGESEDEEQQDETTKVSRYYSDRKKLKKKHSHLLRNILIVGISLLLLAALAVGGIWFYQNYYLQPIHSLTINGSVDSLTVELSSPVNNELLTVICTDTFGNARTQAVVNGRAHFINLDPNTQYRVEVKIDGFHRLTGATTGSFATAAQTEIVNFTAIPGPADGSVNLSFTVKGPDTEYWTVAYFTGNSPEQQTEPFQNHTVTINDLIVGNEYQFRLVPSKDQYLIGTWMIRYTPQQMVDAQDLEIISCSEGKLELVWKAPEGVEDQEWLVRCFNDNGYDVSFTTTETQAEFTGLDHSEKYKIDVTAVGTPKAASISIDPNPITITDIFVTESDDDTLIFNWEFFGKAPDGGWIATYTVNGSDIPEVVSCTENSAQFPKYPGSTYCFDIRPVSNESIKFFEKSFTGEVPQADKFSGYEVSADEMEFHLFRAPDKDDWDAKDVSETDYTESFNLDEQIYVLVTLKNKPEKSEDKISITYLIRDENGVPVSLTKKTKTWKKLWNSKLGTLSIPELPKNAGNFTVDIYFNDLLITQEPLIFSIT